MLKPGGAATVVPGVKVGVALGAANANGRTARAAAKNLNMIGS